MSMKELYLATGYEPDRIAKPVRIRNILGKSPAFGRIGTASSMKKPQESNFYIVSL